MGLTIQLAPEYELSEAPGRGLVLPALHLGPVGENLPHVQKCEVNVGVLSVPVGQGDADHLAAQLQQGYPLLEYQPGTEVALVQRMSISTRPVFLDSPMPPGVRFQLTVRVWYHDSDPQGKPDLAAGVRGPEKATSVLIASDHPAAGVGEPCDLEVDPAEFTLVDRGGPATLTARIYHASRDATPRLILADAFPDAPQLEAALQQLSETRFTRDPAVTGPPGIWRGELSLQLDTEARRSLRDRSQGGPLEVSYRVEVPGAVPVDLTARLLCQEDIFKGLIAIDFGTSNSTVTLYDPGIVEDLTGLAPEQEARLRELLLTELMDEECACKLEAADAQEWQGLVERVGRNLPGDGPPCQRFRSALRAGGLRTFEAIRQLELCLGARPLRREVFRGLNEIYHEAFLEPRLKSQSLSAVPLDPSFPHEKDIPSEVEIKGPGQPLPVLMGRRAQQNRKGAMALATQPPAEGSQGPRSLDHARRLFHLSPKRYLGWRKTFSVPLDSETVVVRADQIVQGAWAQLVELTDQWRNRTPNSCSKGRFTRAVVTYPTVSPPSIRREVERLVQDLRFPDVVTDYDEAVAAALFYLHREFGGSLDLGPEIFKSRSRRHHNKFSQNVLVVDIGGGSTDLALLQLTLEEVDPFQPGEDRGAGGQCYVITPRLLGSSGNSQLGGELITLRLFRLLKASIADRLLRATQDKQLDSPVLAGKMSQLSEGFVDDNGRYEPGSLVEAVEELPENDPLLVDALNAADLILPTRWRNNASRLQAFYTLWDHAEAAKIALGTRTDSDPAAFELGEQEIATLLNQCGIVHSLKDAEAVRVRIDPGQFARPAEPVIQEAIGIARGLLASRLPRHDPSTNGNGNGNGRAPGQEPLDWLILSGKTCNMGLVHQLVRQEFIHSPHFVWNPERVTFVPQYAKLAPSAGACYAEKMRRTAFAPGRYKEQLRKGFNQLTYNIDNLFFFLPCSFLVPVHNGQIEIFQAGQPLYRLDDQEVGKARSAPIGIRLLNAVMRRDFQAATPILWGSFDGMALARELGLPVSVFLNRILMQFEVDYRLFMRIFIWDGSPHYQIDPAAACLDVADVFGQRSRNGGAGEGSSAPLPTPGVSPTSEEPPRAGWDISVDVLQSQTNSRPASALIAADQELTEVFHEVGSGRLSRGVIAPVDDLFNQEGDLMIHARPPGSSEWIHIGDLPRPVGTRSSGPGQEHTTEYPRQYRLTLDDAGVLRLHLGEVPYWKTEDLAEWKDHPGMVLERELEVVEPPSRENRDPFCGVH